MLSLNLPARTPGFRFPVEKGTEICCGFTSIPPSGASDSTSRVRRDKFKRRFFIGLPFIPGKHSRSNRRVREIPVIRKTAG